MININNFYILSLWNLFETEIVTNWAVLPFKNLISIKKFWVNGDVFLNFSTFCWYLDFLSIVSLVATWSHKTNFVRFVATLLLGDQWPIYDRRQAPCCSCFNQGKYTKECLPASFARWPRNCLDECQWRGISPRP